ncbi:hypothetical protein ABMC89_05250 [Sulfitobacter sp. HNIBRBA3233]|uniref:calcium-binding protein n=1 Tax=Sulfitobacter marinivivus TaxID=3158558 RepID=UPI0032DF28FE
MLMLLGLLPLALIGFVFDSDTDDDENSITENGTEGNDTIAGETGDDFIDGEGGDDLLSGLAGDDTIFGRDGDDVLEGADGRDMLCSGDGEDIVTGNRGSDLIEGQGGDDWVSGDYGFDTVRGDEGDDTVIGGRGSDTVVGGEGDDLIFGGILQGIPLSLEEMAEVRDGASLAEVNGGIDMRADSLGNALRGGDGDDDIILGDLDVATGNAGADTFHIMSEQRIGEPSQINDYSPGSDAITIIVENTEAEADITVTADGPNAIISLNGVMLATVNNAADILQASDITLIAEDTVEAMFDPNAAAAA